MWSVGNKRGFTLLEMLLTMAILAIAASLVGPAFLRMVENRQLDGASREIAAVLRQAREQAIREQRVLLVKLGPKESRVQLIEPGEKVLGEIVLPSGVRVKEIEPGGSLTEGRGMTERSSEAPDQGGRILVFTPSGTAEDAQIVLENERGRQVRVRMDGFTGMARVERVEQTIQR